MICSAIFDFCIAITSAAGVEMGFLLIIVLVTEEKHSTVSHRPCNRANGIMDYESRLVR